MYVLSLLNRFQRPGSLILIGLYWVFFFFFFWRTELLDLDRKSLGMYVKAVLGPFQAAHLFV